MSLSFSFFLPLDGLIFPGGAQEGFPPLEAQVLLSPNGLRRTVLFQGGQKGLSPISTRESLGLGPYDAESA